MFVAKQWSDAGGSEELACTRDMSRRAQRRDITPATFLFTQIRQAHRQIFMKMNEDEGGGGVMRIASTVKKGHGQWQGLGMGWNMMRRGCGR